MGDLSMPRSLFIPALSKLSFQLREMRNSQTRNLTLLSKHAGSGTGTVVTSAGRKTTFFRENGGTNPLKGRGVQSILGGFSGQLFMDLPLDQATSVFFFFFFRLEGFIFEPNHKLTAIDS